MALTKEQRAAINRENSKKSTGPRTPEGKARSRMNARRHGLTGQLLIFEEGERKHYNRFARDQRETWEPVGPLEDHLIQQIIDTSWILRRADSLEMSLNGVETATVADAGFHDDPLAAIAATHHYLFDTEEGMKRYEAMGRHQARLEKSVSKYRNELLKAQTERRKIEANQEKEANREDEANHENKADRQIPPSQAERYYEAERRAAAKLKEPEEVKDILDAVHVAREIDPETPRGAVIRTFHDNLWLAKLTQEEKDAYFREVNRRARIKLGDDPNTLPPSGWIPPGLTKMGEPHPFHR